MGKKAEKKPLSPALLARLLRVNQAGEYGAKRIYAGQLQGLRWRGADAQTLRQIEQMAAQEETHLAAFSQLIAANQVRPTALQPVWHVAGFALGLATALLGNKAAMACTVAVEEVIDRHYAAQAELLEKTPAKAAPQLKAVIDQFRREENDHRETALEAGAEQTPLYGVLRHAIKAGAKAAIWLAERV